jgi:hypothetical protein
MMADFPPNLEVSIVTDEIRIIRGINDDGMSVYMVAYGHDGEYGKLPNIIDGLGLLDAARIDFLERLDLIRNCNTEAWEEDGG